MSRAAFEARFGLAPLEEANREVVQRCRAFTTHPADPQAQERSVPLMRGRLWNTGFVPEGQDFDRLDPDWDRLAHDLAFLQPLAQRLQAAGCLHRSWSEAPYFPFICLPALPAGGFLEGFMAHLGTPPLPLNDFGACTRRLSEQPFFDHDASAEAGEHLTPEEAAAYQLVTHALRAELTDVHEFALLGGFDQFPKFLLGRTRRGFWLGFVTLSVDPDAYL